MLDRIIENLHSLIRGISQHLAKIGLVDGSWKKVRLSEVLKERNELNTQHNEVFSVSVSMGLINQIEYLGRSFAAKDTSNYNVVHYGDIVYTKSPTGEFPYGIIKQSYISHNVAVSPLYGVYEPSSFEIGQIIHNYFLSPTNTKNYLNKLIQKGAKNTINITNSRFLDNDIPLPQSKAKIRKVSNLIEKLSAQIYIEKQFLHQLQIQKEYLLNKLFI